MLTFRDRFRFGDLISTALCSDRRKCRSSVSGANAKHSKERAVDKYGLIPFTSVFARFRRWSSAPTERSVARERTLIEVAYSFRRRRRCVGFPARLMASLRDEVEKRLRSVGPNQVAHQAHHTIVSEVVGRSINPLNALLLSLAAACYFLSDQRAAIVIAVMVVLSVSLGFLQEHRSNNAADALRRMVLTTATLRRRGWRPRARPCRRADRSDRPRRRRLAVGRRHDPGRFTADLGEGSLHQPVGADRRGNATRKGR